MKDNKYISDITQAEKNSQEYGDSPVLIAGEKDKDCCEKCEEEKKIGNQSKEYYNNK